jgi:hypothetical protein
MSIVNSIGQLPSKFAAPRPTLFRFPLDHFDDFGGVIKAVEGGHQVNPVEFGAQRLR